MQRVTALLLFALAIACPASTAACTIPVFRYALERWELDKFELLYFHKDKLGQADRAALYKAERDANVLITTVDLNEPLSPLHEKLWKKHGGETLPHVILRREHDPSFEQPVWSGLFDAATWAEHLNSPMRQRVLHRLMQGDSSVFVLVLSGDQARDEQAEALLRKELAVLEKKIKIPVQSDDGPKIRLSLPLHVRFSLLIMRPDQAGEAGFLHQMMSVEPDLPKVQGPMLFPIFGRGRVLGCLYGEDLNADILFRAASFLCGECSCEIKSLNPGADLIMAADWHKLFDEHLAVNAPFDLSPLTPTKHARSPRPTSPNEPQAAPPSSLAAPVPTVTPSVSLAERPVLISKNFSPRRLLLWTATVAAAVLVLLTGQLAWSLRK